MSHNYDSGVDAPDAAANEPDVNDFLQDHKEKRKLLERWPHYFPHEPAKEFDVSQTN